jgi:hypothetical protein
MVIQQVFQMEVVMGPSRTELMQFKVTPEERKLIEKVAKRQGMTVSEYVRASVIMDMVLEGEVGAMKIVVDTVGRKAVQLLRKRADRLADLGAEATDSQ